MKIEINNFGPIHHFTFDLDKDLHILYGKNSIGKSYAISVVYLILKSFLEGEGLAYNFFGRAAVPNYNELVIKVLNSKANRFSIKEEVEVLIADYIRLERGLFEKLSDAISNSYDLENIKSKFSNQPAFIRISLKYLDIKLGLDNGEIVLEEANIKNINDWILKKGEANIEYFLENKVYIELDEHQSSIVDVKIVEVFDWIIDVKNIYRQIYFLPASRSGLYEGMNIFSSLLVQLSQSRHNLTQKIEIPALPIPTSDYLLNISTIKKHQPTGVYAELAAKIEQKILNAEVLFNNDNKKLEYYNKEIDLKLDIGETSSMISEVAPIVAHLKYILKEDKEKSVKILFIEEPEAHLHPEVQIALMEIFAEMTQHNIKIILTTHSNYIFNKVNNMILNETIAADQLGVHHLIMTDKGSIQNPNIFDAVTGIIDENFVETTQKLYQERLDATD